jgi:hypothetical protein
MTIVNRRTFIPKRGHQQEVIDMLKGEEGSAYVSRVYTAHYGPFDVAVLEVEFADLAAMEAGWNAWSASERAANIMPRWLEITEPGGSNEVWQITTQSAGGNARFVNRRTFQARQGQLNVLTELLSTGANHMPYIPPFRISHSLFGPGSLAALKIAFPEITAHNEFWDAFRDAPETPAVMERFNQLVEPAWTNEIWQLH